MSRRNPHAFDAWFRNGGFMSGKRRPDVFDNINGYEEEDMAELRNRKHNFDVGDRVVCISPSPYCGCEGLIVKRDENSDGNYVWTVDFEGAGFNRHLSNELERVY